MLSTDIKTEKKAEKKSEKSDKKTAAKDLLEKVSQIYLYWLSVYLASIYFSHGLYYLCLSSLL